MAQIVEHLGVERDAALASVSAAIDGIRGRVEERAATRHRRLHDGQFGRRGDHPLDEMRGEEGAPQIAMSGD
ncbi:MAG: hypothetical protein GYB50_18645 [Rhodobacteraceae bacterium]|nr:hypothetical protein [Paracoccaceae bacterium]